MSIRSRLDLEIALPALASAAATEELRQQTITADGRTTSFLPSLPPNRDPDLP